MHWFAIPKLWNAVPKGVECHPDAVPAGSIYRNLLLTSYAKEQERYPDAVGCRPQLERYPDAHSFVQAACFSRRVLSSILAPAIISKRSSSERASVKAATNLFIGLL